MNGSVIGNLGMAGASGLLRNNASAWISGFSLNMGITSNIIVELRSVCFDGKPCVKIVFCVFQCLVA